MSIIAIGVLCRRPPLIRTIPASLQGATCGPPRYIGMAPSEEGGRDNRPFVGRLILDPCNLKYLPSHFPPVSVSFQCYWRLPGLRTVVRVHALLLALHRSRPLLSSFVWFHYIRAHAPSSRSFVHPSTPVRIVGSNPLSGPVRFVLFQPRLPLVCAITTPTDLCLYLSRSLARCFSHPLAHAHPSLPQNLARISIRFAGIGRGTPGTLRTDCARYGVRPDMCSNQYSVASMARASFQHKPEWIPHRAPTRIRRKLESPFSFGTAVRRWIAWSFLGSQGPRSEKAVPPSMRPAEGSSQACSGHYGVIARPGAVWQNALVNLAPHIREAVCSVGGNPATSGEKNCPPLRNPERHHTARAQDVRHKCRDRACA